MQVPPVRTMHHATHKCFISCLGASYIIHTRGIIPKSSMSSKKQYLKEDVLGKTTLIKMQNPNLALPTLQPYET